MLRITQILIILINLFIFIECKQLFLTPYIESNRLSEAKNLSFVKSLPNAPNIESHSGFITIDKKFNSNLFFWFFPSFKNPKTAPVVVWLEGGPGASSIWSLFGLNGPFDVQKNLSLTLKPYHWVQEFSVLFIDNPVGTGYSFTTDERGFSKDQNSVADNLYEFLQQFYKLFNEYRDNELYITGESYAGKYVPAIGYKLMQMKDKSNINFKGIAIGNGLTDPANQMNYSKYLRALGLIDESQAIEIEKIENKTRLLIKQEKYELASEYFRDLMLSRNGFKSVATNMTGFMDFQNALKSYDLDDDVSINMVKYMNQIQTQNSLHVGDMKFAPGNDSVFDHLVSDVTVSVVQNMTALIKNFKVMLYVGNLDMLIGVSQVNGMLENPDWKYNKDFYSAKRVVWRVDKNDKEVAGYVKGFGNFKQVIIRNAGHSVPGYQPRAALDMLRRFINNEPFEE